MPIKTNQHYKITLADMSYGHVGAEGPSGPLYFKRGLPAPIWIYKDNQFRLKDAPTDARFLQPILPITQKYGYQIGLLKAPVASWSVNDDNVIITRVIRTERGDGFFDVIFGGGTERNLVTVGTSVTSNNTLMVQPDTLQPTTSLTFTKVDSDGKDEEGGGHESCGKGQVLRDNICITCEPGYIAKNNTCVPCGENEISFNYQCQTCPPGTAPSNNRCKRCKPGFISDQAKCVPCDINSISQNNVCVKCLGDRRPVNNECSTCEPGYVVFRGECKRCSSREISKNNACVPCAANAVIKDNKCEVCPADAVIENNLCRRCNPGYQPVLNKCKKCPENTISVVGVCTACPSGQVADNNKCVAKTDEDDSNFFSSPLFWGLLIGLGLLLIIILIVIALRK
jgi:hypothetical protein